MLKILQKSEIVFSQNTFGTIFHYVMFKYTSNRYFNKKHLLGREHKYLEASLVFYWRHEHMNLLPETEQK